MTSSESEAESQPEMSQSHRYYKDEERSSRRKSTSGKRTKGSRASLDSREIEPRSKKRYSSERSRSRSRSGSPFEESRYREEDRDTPNPSHCLGVFGLSSFTDEKDLKSVFGQYGPIENIYLIYDREHGKSKGFGFVYFKNTDDAVEARKATQGLEMDGRPIRVDYSLTTRPHPPTPGRYLGRTSQRNFRRYDRGGYSGGYGGGGYSRGRRDGGGYSRGGRKPSYRQSNYDDQYYDDYQESSYSSRRRRYSSPPYSSRHY